MQEAEKQEEVDFGLSIADTIVKAHNGSIKAMHNTPKGTIFTVRLSR